MQIPEQILFFIFSGEMISDQNNVHMTDFTYFWKLLKCLVINNIFLNVHTFAIIPGTDVVLKYNQQ